MRKIIKYTGISLEVIVGASAWFVVEAIEGLYHQGKRGYYEVTKQPYGPVLDNSENFFPRYKKLELKNNPSS